MHIYAHLKNNKFIVDSKCLDFVIEPKKKATKKTKQPFT